MSWAEVKKFLNKRNDKSLDEIIREPEQRTSGGMELASSSHTSNGTVFKIEGSGRILYFALAHCGAANSSCKFDFIIDGKSAWSVIDTYTGTSPTHPIKIVSYGKNTPRDREGYVRAIMDNTGKSQQVSVDTFSPMSGGTLAISSTSEVKRGILMPDYLLFNKSFELVVTFTGSQTNVQTSGYNYETIGYTLD